MEKRLAIFDLDGTLLDTISDLGEACNHMLRMRGAAEHTRQEYCQMVGNGIRNLAKRALPEHMRSEEETDRAKDDLVAWYSEHIDIHTRPYPGIMDLISRLRQEGFILAVASNKFHSGTLRLIDRFFEKDTFKAVYGNREGFPLKPSRELVELIMSECSASPRNTVMVGDSGVDMLTAQNAGIGAIGVSWGFRSREELTENGAECVCSDTDELYREIVCRCTPRI